MPTKSTKTKKEVKEKVVAKTATVKKVTTRSAAPKAVAGSRYIEAVGRRKTSTARVRITVSPKESLTVNGKEMTIYFPTKELQSIAREAIEKSKVVGIFSVSVVLRGGGIHSQAEALRHGLSRTIVKFDEETRKRLKKHGFLKRDPRMKERRKFGLKKARKAPQWSKR